MAKRFGATEAEHRRYAINAAQRARSTSAVFRDMVKQGLCYPHVLADAIEANTEYLVEKKYSDRRGRRLSKLESRKLNSARGMARDMVRACVVAARGNAPVPRRKRK